MPIEYNIVRVFKKEKEEARAEGRSEGKAEAIVKLLESRGAVSEELREKILSIQDMKALDKLLDLAIESQTVEEFVKRKEAGNI